MKLRFVLLAVSPAFHLTRDSREASPFVVRHDAFLLRCSTESSINHSRTMPPHGESSSLLPKNGDAMSARKAFEGFDAEASKLSVRSWDRRTPSNPNPFHSHSHSSFLAPHNRAYHDQRAEGSEEMHQTEGGLLKPVIFGGLDGTLTAFAIVAGAAGGNLSTGVVLILGFSNILADALSMGVGEFLSSKAENEWILSERRREDWGA